MASNDDLVKLIKQIQPSFEEGSLTNKELVLVLKNLHNAPNSAVETQKEVLTPKKKTIELKSSRDGYRVPKGKSITTKAGIKSHGDIITVDIVSGGEVSFRELIKKGLIV